MVMLCRLYRLLFVLLFFCVKFTHGNFQGNGELKDGQEDRQHEKNLAKEPTAKEKQEEEDRTIEDFFNNFGGAWHLDSKEKREKMKIAKEIAAQQRLEQICTIGSVYYNQLLALDTRVNNDMNVLSHPYKFDHIRVEYEQITRSKLEKQMDKAKAALELLGSSDKWKCEKKEGKGEPRQIQHSCQEWQQFHGALVNWIKFIKYARYSGILSEARYRHGLSINGQGEKVYKNMENIPTQLAKRLAIRPIADFPNEQPREDIILMIIKVLRNFNFWERGRELEELTWSNKETCHFFAKWVDVFKSGINLPEDKKMKNQELEMILKISRTSLYNAFYNEQCTLSGDNLEFTNHFKREYNEEVAKEFKIKQTKATKELELAATVKKKGKFGQHWQKLQKVVRSVFTRNKAKVVPINDESIVAR